MQYDVLLTDIGADEVSVSLALMNSIQQALPLAVLDVNQARDWLSYLPILLRRRVDGDVARAIQQRYEELGGAVAIIPSKLFFPENARGISKWRNELFSEHLVALHERVLLEWAQDTQVQEAYRFSFLPTFGNDMTMRLWSSETGIYASARRSIGRIGPLPGPPLYNTQWEISDKEWQDICSAIKEHDFWSAETWNTVPEGYTIISTDHWVMEGVRGKDYKVLLDQTPNEGSAREVGLLLLDLLPDNFALPPIE
ncbi:MAG: hypothetical protein Phog2KO_34240 [Phototrophicaceae bacterium]